MAYHAERTWVAGELVRIHGQLFTVFMHGNGREEIVLQDETGKLVTMPTAHAAVAIEYTSPAEIERFSRSYDRWMRRQLRAERACRILDTLAAILPTRIVNEELGDYIEDINRRIAAGQKKLVWLRVATAIIWTGLNAFGYALKQVRTGRRSV